MDPVIVLFHQDLRLKDNPALTAAAETKAPLILLYVFDEKTQKPMGAAQKWWLHESLKKLHPSLVLRKGPLAKTVLQVAKESKASALYFNRGYEPLRIKAEKELAKSDLEINTFKGNLLVEPWEIKPKSSDYYKVFTPFWKTCLSQIDPEKSLSAPRFKCASKIKSEKLESWKLQPKHPDWAKEFKKLWTPGEKGAHAKLTRFLKEDLKDYHIKRDRPDLDTTSHLSPHLHFGEISPRDIWHAVKKRGRSKGAETFLKELGWREFSYHLLYHFPALDHKNFNEKFNKFKWRSSPKDLKAWQKGLTGYPIVDAGMRQLWQEGWMHNRVRMICASFLIKDLLIDWRKGEAWFWDTLVDADFANNSASWQWVAGSGADAAPFFRIFNPITQGEKFDPEGAYIRRYLPELNDVPDEFIHTPWEFDEEIDYPSPIVDHDEARQEALARFKKL